MSKNICRFCKSGRRISNQPAEITSRSEMRFSINPTGSFLSRTRYTRIIWISTSAFRFTSIALFVFWVNENYRLPQCSFGVINNERSWFPFRFSSPRFLIAWNLKSLKSSPKIFQREHRLSRSSARVLYNFVAIWLTLRSTRFDSPLQKQAKYMLCIVRYSFVTSKCVSLRVHREKATERYFCERTLTIIKNKSFTKRKTR